MEYAKKMALVDPRMWECVPSQLLSANPIGSITRRIDDEIRFILDRYDLNDREKVVLYNQVLMSYNLFSGKAFSMYILIINTLDLLVHVSSKCDAVSSPGSHVTQYVSCSTFKRRSVSFK